MTVTASDAETIFLMIGAKVRLAAPVHVNSAEKNVETSAARERLRAATPKSPWGIGQNAWTTSKLPSRAIRAAAADPEATYEGSSARNAGERFIRSTAGMSCVSVSSADGA